MTGWPPGPRCGPPWRPLGRCRRLGSSRSRSPRARRFSHSSAWRTRSSVSRCRSLSSPSGCSTRISSRRATSRFAISWHFRYRRGGSPEQGEIHAQSPGSANGVVPLLPRLFPPPRRLAGHGADRGPKPRAPGGIERSPARGDRRRSCRSRPDLDLRGPLPATARRARGGGPDTDLGRAVRGRRREGPPDRIDGWDENHRGVPIGRASSGSGRPAPPLIFKPRTYFMPPIVTLTMNPTIDENSSVEYVFSDVKLRCRAPSLEPGGGGINVARAVARLGGEALAVYAAGGPSGDLLKQLLDREGDRKSVV